MQYFKCEQESLQSKRKPGEKVIIEYLNWRYVKRKLQSKRIFEIKISEETKFTIQMKNLVWKSDNWIFELNICKKKVFNPKEKPGGKLYQGAPRIVKFLWKWSLNIWNEDIWKQKFKIQKKNLMEKSDNWTF